ncbi:rod shape-determining protein MreC [Sphingomonas sp.]|uniref:rod shape-determining protein MreC n=1 Tax=Sphingomonas sp. TaxID=28214 RepID=UPI0025F16856|nr:rod shape-determining protein MreC [Sphingomonas sp.]MBV9526780.1 rod shape-determining protein MreC [Sphingomonas sp.]
MATARPGWSRRAQYGLFFSFLALIAGLLFGLILLALSLLAPAKFQQIRGAALDLTAPAASSLRGVTTTVEGLGSGASDYWDATSQNGELKRERTAMLRRMVEAKAIFQENQQLKALLHLREHEPATVAIGRVVGSSFNSPRRFAILSAGTRDGVQVGMPVRSADGLVGRIIDAGALGSRVLLVSDRANIVPARLLRGGMPVISQGRGDGTIDVRPLEVGRNPFRRGDIIITSGTGGLYPPLVPIARVVKLDDDGAVAVPLADPANISFATVEPPYEPAAIDSQASPDQDVP